MAATEASIGRELAAKRSSSVHGQEENESFENDVHSSSLFDLSTTTWSLTEISQDGSDGEAEGFDEIDMSMPPELEMQIQEAEGETTKKRVKRRMTMGHGDVNYIDKIESFAWKQSMSDFSGISSSNIEHPSHAFEQMLKKRNEEFMYLYELNSMLRSLSMGMSQAVITKLSVDNSMGTTASAAESGRRKRDAYQKMKKDRRHSSAISINNRAVAEALQDVEPGADVDDLIRNAETERERKRSVAEADLPPECLKETPTTRLAHTELEFRGDINSSPMPAQRRKEPDLSFSPSTASAASPPMRKSKLEKQLSFSVPAPSQNAPEEPVMSAPAQSSGERKRENKRGLHYGVGVVNDVSFEQSSKLTPRKLGTVQVTLDVKRATYSLLDYAMRYFDTGKSKDAKRTKMKRAIVAEKKPIRNPLHTFSSAEQKANALECFQSILDYCHKRRDAKCEDMSDCFVHTREVVRIGMNQPNLRDEVFAQLLKQVSSNKKYGVYVWELLASCLGCFVPSAVLMPYLNHFLEEASKDGDAETAEWAKFCINRLEKMSKCCKRTFAPTNRELMFVLKKKAMLTTFFFCNGKQKQIPVYSSTTVTEALEFLCTMTGIQDREGYSIFEVYERAVPGRKYPEIIERSLLLNEHVSNSLTKFELFTSQIPPDQCPKTVLLVKRKLFLSRTIMPDPPANTLLLEQLGDAVARGELPCNIEDAEILCALRLQATFGALEIGEGDEASLAQKELKRAQQIMEWIPRPLLRTAKNHPWVEAVVDQYGSMSDMKQEEARLYYLRYCTELPLYGYHLFEARHCRGVESWEMPPRIRIGVNVAGVHFLNRHTKESYHVFSFGEIVSFHASPSNLLLSFFSGRSITFITDHGDEIVSLIIDYKYHELKNLSASFALPI